LCGEERAAHKKRLSPAGTGRCGTGNNECALVGSRGRGGEDEAGCTWVRHKDNDEKLMQCMLGSVPKPGKVGGEREVYKSHTGEKKPPSRRRTLKKGGMAKDWESKEGPEAPALLKARKNRPRVWKRKTLNKKRPGVTRNR